MFWYIESNRRINQQIIMKKDIGICAIGAGRAAMIHANNHKNKVKGSHIESVVDVVEETVRRAGEELGTEKCYTDYRQAICDPAVDAVVIAAPTDMTAIPAAAAPREIAATAGSFFNPSTAATRQPVHTPVPGKGNATRATRPGRLKLPKLSRRRPP